jgi:hypothetical protein
MGAPHRQGCPLRSGLPPSEKRLVSAIRAPWGQTGCQNVGDKSLRRSVGWWAPLSPRSLLDCQVGEVREVPAVIGTAVCAMSVEGKDWGIGSCVLGLLGPSSVPFSVPKSDSESVEAAQRAVGCPQARKSIMTGGVYSLLVRRLSLGCFEP